MPAVNTLVSDCSRTLVKRAFIEKENIQHYKLKRGNVHLKRNFFFFSVCFFPKPKSQHSSHFLSVGFVSQLLAST